MTAARLLGSLAILTTISGVAHAQNGCARLSWNTCDPSVLNSNFVGPGKYTMIESVFGLGTPNVGTDSQIRLRSSAFSDAWRFDDDGCQSGRLALNNNAFSKSCPAMKGANPHTNTHYIIDPDGSAVLRLAISYDAFSPVATTHYVLWQIVFDHSLSNAGETPPDHSTCGGAEVCEEFYFDFVKVFTTTGQGLYLPGCDQNPLTCTDATWNGGCINDGPFGGCSPVPADTRTWGRVRATYR